MPVAFWLVGMWASMVVGMCFGHANANHQAKVTPPAIVSTQPEKRP